MVNKEEILDKLEIQSQGDYLRKDVLKAMDEMYNCAVLDAAEVADNMIRPYHDPHTKEIVDRIKKLMK